MDFRYPFPGIGKVVGAGQVMVGLEGLDIFLTDLSE